MGDSVKEDRLSAARARAAADAKAKADAIAKKKAESAAAAKLQSERKAYAAREATEKAERCARALVMDTDIGWNPDDIIAVWTLCMYTLRSRTRVLIISSDEIYPQNPRHQLIQRIINAVSEDVKDLGWDRHPQDLARERFSLIKTAPGLPCPNAGLLASGFSIFEKVYPAETAAQAAARLPVQVCNFMLQMKEEGRPVLWIGLASMSNLRAVLSHGGVAPDAIVQSGGSAGRTDSAVQADAGACSGLLQLSLEYRIPLTFVTNDTGESPCLLWFDSLRSGQPLQRLAVNDSGTNLSVALRDFPHVLQLVTDCTKSQLSQSLPTSFEGASFLHAPLTLLHALAPLSSFSPLPVVPACVKCDSLIPASICSHGREMQWCKECWGKWTVFVDRAEAEAAANALWWHHSRMHGSHFRDMSVSSGDESNCSVTIGWIHEDSARRFRAALLKLLSAEPPL